MQDAMEFQYRVPWRAASFIPGSHLGIQRGAGYEIHGHVPFYVSGDPRRFDLRASLRDPYKQLLVRVYKQKSVVPVIILGDVSASMSFVGRTCKYDLLIEFVGSTAASAYRVGDPFAFIACDSIVQERLSLALTRTRGAGALLSRRLHRWVPSGAGATGLLAGAERITATRALIFLASDFYLPIELLRRLLDRLHSHAVVPVVIGDTAENQAPGFGITHLYDPETRDRRAVLLRRSWARRFQMRIAEHRERLLRCFSDHDLRPLFMVDRFEPADVTRYFYD